MKEVKEKPLRIVLHTSFQFAHWENANNVAMALAKSGYFINIIKVSEAFKLDIYKRF